MFNKTLTETSSQPSKKDSETNSLFFKTVNKTTLAISQASAGAGVLGLLGCAGLFAVATVFFVTGNFFLAMLMAAGGLLGLLLGNKKARKMAGGVAGYGAAAALGALAFKAYQNWQSGADARTAPVASDAEMTAAPPPATHGHTGRDSPNDASRKMVPSTSSKSASTYR